MTVPPTANCAVGRLDSVNARLAVGSEASLTPPAAPPVYYFCMRGITTK
jgi:hypothetical protein